MTFRFKIYENDFGKWAAKRRNRWMIYEWHGDWEEDSMDALKTKITKWALEEYDRVVKNRKNNNWRYKERLVIKL